MCENGKYLERAADDLKLCVVKLYMLWILYQKMQQILYQQMCQQTIMLKK